MKTTFTSFLAIVLSLTAYSQQLTFRNTTGYIPVFQTQLHNTGIYNEMAKTGVNTTAEVLYPYQMCSHFRISAGIGYEFTRANFDVSQLVYFTPAIPDYTVTYIDGINMNLHQIGVPIYAHGQLGRHNNLLIGGGWVQQFVMSNNLITHTSTDKGITSKTSIKDKGVALLGLAKLEAGYRFQLKSNRELSVLTGVSTAMDLSGTKFTSFNNSFYLSLSYSLFNNH